MKENMTTDLIHSGIAACKNEAFDEGVDLFTKALDLEPRSIEALYNRARAYAKLGQLIQSLEDFKQLVEIEPNNANYIGDYAVSLHLNKKDDEALLQFEKAIAIDSKNPYRYSSLAFFKDRTGNPEEAIAAYEKAIALDPEDAIALNNKGLIEEKIGRQQASKESFKQSNELIGYEPKSESNVDNQQLNKSQTIQRQSFETKADIFKSLLTKDGFSDFLKFTKDIFRKKKS